MYVLVSFMCIIVHVPVSSPHSVIVRRSRQSSSTYRLETTPTSCPRNAVCLPLFGCRMLQKRIKERAWSVRRRASTPSPITTALPRFEPRQINLSIDFVVNILLYYNYLLYNRISYFSIKHGLNRS